ncbi:MAG: glycoside hydrolase family 57 protein [Chromatiales bacterium]
MSAKHGRLKVVLCWHMHQPDYRGPDHSQYQLPWAYLHGIKDYTDMVFHLEEHPDARAVVNFAPVLLEQITDYGQQIRDWLERGRLVSDPVLAALAGPGLPLDNPSRRTLLEACLRANQEHLINRFPVFRELVELARWFETHEESDGYLSDAFLADLLVWYHLAWMGESIRTNDVRIKSLEKKARGFDHEDRRRLVEVIGEQLSGIVERYRRLAEAGRVELSVTPYAHPIVPLLLDMRSAREALPDAPMPELKEYPGGEERARWHVRHGLGVFERHFGFRPQGCWPSEGAVSTETVQLLEAEGFRWAASGQQVLLNSLNADSNREALPGHWNHAAYRVGKGRLACFFRDDGLSDLIGFTYANWHADDAVGNLLQHLETIAEATADKPDAVVSIIMDGENAWEYYPRNGFYFLSALYQRLAAHPGLELTTFSACLRKQRRVPAVLPRLVAGSWVYGTLSTWIGDPDKNRAWDMLGDAKKAYDAAVQGGAMDDEQVAAARMQLARCEGSDWFWWFGDYNPADTVSDFERLFRQQLRHLYALIGQEPPEYLAHVFAHGTGKPTMGGVMRQNV